MCAECNEPLVVEKKFTSPTPEPIVVTIDYSKVKDGKYEHNFDNDQNFEKSQQLVLNVENKGTNQNTTSLWNQICKHHDTITLIKIHLVSETFKIIPSIKVII